MPAVTVSDVAVLPPRVPDPGGASADRRVRSVTIATLYGLPMTEPIPHGVVPRLPECPFVRGWIAKHPEYQDLVPIDRRPAFGLG